MQHNRLSIWEPIDICDESKQNNDDEKRKNWSKRVQTILVRWCRCCSAPTLVGLLIGMLFAGVALATVLTLYLRKSGSVMINSTMISTNPLAGITASTTTTAGVNINVVKNGDAENGSCEMGNNVTHPTGWNYNGTITQISYNNTIYGDQTYSDPGPSNRGQCYFFGQYSNITSMWQTVNLTNYVGPLLIDGQIVQFNLSAWLGGYQSQDDSVVVSVNFADQFNQAVSNGTSIGPVLAADRGGQTSLLFRQANGFIPVGARFMTLLVTINHFSGLTNDGDVDNIALILHQ